MFFFSELLFILEVIIISNLISVWFCFIKVFLTKRPLTYNVFFLWTPFYTRGYDSFESHLSLVLLYKSVSYKKAFQLQCFFLEVINISNLISVWFYLIKVFLTKRPFTYNVFFSVNSFIQEVYNYFESNLSLVLLIKVFLPKKLFIYNICFSLNSFLYKKL